MAPLAATRLTEDVLPPDLVDRFKPEYVTPLVLYLCSDRCPSSGGVYNAGMGFFSQAAIVSGPGAWLGDGEDVPTPEAVAANWKKITSLQGAQAYDDANAALMDMLTGPEETKDEGPKTESGGASVGAIFEQMSDAFQPGAAAGVDVVFQYNISGADGGDWYVVIKNGECAVETGAHSSPTTTLNIADKDFLDLIGGRLPAMQAYTSGKLKIGGDLMKSQLVEKLFKF